MVSIETSDYLSHLYPAHRMEMAQTPEGRPLQLLSGGDHQSFIQTPFYVAGGGMSLNPTVNITIPQPTPGAVSTVTPIESPPPGSSRVQISPKPANGTKMGRWLKDRVSLLKSKPSSSSNPGAIASPEGIIVVSLSESPIPLVPINAPNFLVISSRHECRSQ